MTDSFAGSIEPMPFDAAQTCAPYDAVLRLGTDLRCLHADATFAALFALDAAALSNQLLSASSLPKTVVTTLTTLAEDVVAKRVPHRAQVAWWQAGQWRDADILALPEHAAHDSLQAIVLCISGVSVQLAQARAARASAEAAVFARDRMLTIASHDLRGPLNAIHSWGHVLERKLPLDDAALQRALGGIRTGVEQQVKLIEKVLDAPRAATRVPSLERGPVALRALLDEVLANLRATFASRRGALIEVGSPLPDGRLSADRERLWQALWIALAYAVDASAPGANISLKSAIADGAWRMTIAYHLSPATLTDAGAAHAFEPYIRVEALQERRANDVPLALSLPRQIIEAHGGEFSAPPTSGNGEAALLELGMPLVAGVAETIPVSS